MANPFNNSAPPANPNPWVAGEPSSIRIDFCSPGAAQRIPYFSGITGYPWNWHTGTLWSLTIPVHWTGTCWTGLETLWVGGNGDVYSGTQTYSPSAGWPGGYIFQDLPNVKLLGIGINLTWNGEFWACGVGFTDFKNPQGGVNGRSGAKFPVLGQTPAIATAVPPWWTIPVCNRDEVFTFDGIIPYILPADATLNGSVILPAGKYWNNGPHGTATPFYPALPTFTSPAGLQIGGANQVYTTLNGERTVPAIGLGTGFVVQYNGVPGSYTILNGGQDYLAGGTGITIIYLQELPNGVPIQNATVANGSVTAIDSTSYFPSPGIYHASDELVLPYCPPVIESMCPLPLAVAGAGDWFPSGEVGNYTPANYTYPMWIGNALPANNVGFGTDQNTITYLDVTFFSEMPLSNGYSLYVYTLANA